MSLLEACELFKIFYSYFHVFVEKKIIYIIGDQLHIQAWQNFPFNR